MTWDAGKTNQILSRSLNGYRYYYSFDDEYNMSVISKEQSINIHEVDKNAYKNANKHRERNVSIRGNGRNNRSSIDASERASTLPRENAPNVEGQIRREGKGYRAGYDEDGDYDNLQKEKRYSLKEPEYGSEIFIENEELADAAESLQEMLRYVSAENNELRSAFDIKTDSLDKKTVNKVGRNAQVRPTARRGCYQQPAFSSACHASRFAYSNLSKYKKAVTAKTVTAFLAQMERFARLASALAGTHAANETGHRAVSNASRFACSNLLLYKKAVTVKTVTAFLAQMERFELSRRLPTLRP